VVGVGVRDHCLQVVERGHSRMGLVGMGCCLKGAAVSVDRLLEDLV
jgi:hypothetical protein